MSVKKFQIGAPTQLHGAVGYKRECEFVIEPLLAQLVKDAVSSGWDELEVAFAVLSLCDHYIYGADEHPSHQ